jgi:hypothetical protein
MRRIAMAMTAAALLWTLPATAHATTWVEGTPGNPFHLTGLVAGTTPAVGGTASDQALVMPYDAKVLYKGLTGSVADPRSLDAAPDGTLLVADGNVNRVVGLNESTGAATWSWTYKSLWGYEPLGAWAATARGNNVIVTDRNSGGVFGRVIEIDRSTGDPVRPPFEIVRGFLEDPFYAAPVGTDHTLICDGKKGKDSSGNDVPGCRVIELDAGGNIVWWYGTLHVSGSGPNQLMSPKTAQRIPAGLVGAGNTLITDADSYRVIEVPTVQGALPIWQFSTSGYSPPFVPSSALRLADGTTLITDEANGRVVLIDHGSPAKVLESWGVGTENRVSASFLAQRDANNQPIAFMLNQPRSAVRLPNGSIAVADQVNHRVVTFAYRTTATVTSAALDMGLPNVPKFFSSISWNAHGASGTSVAVRYRIDSGAWSQPDSTGAIKLPDSAVGSTISYQVTLATSNGANAPVLDDLTITWGGPGSSGAGSGAGSGTWNGSTSGSGGGSGTGTGTGTGTGSQAVGTATPGGDAQILSGLTGRSGSGTGSGVTAAGTLSGWVMTQDTRASAGLGPSGSGSDGQTGGTGKSPVTGALPGILLLSMAYAAGAAWPQVIRLAASLRSAISIQLPA